MLPIFYTGIALGLAAACVALFGFSRGKRPLAIVIGVVGSILIVTGLSVSASYANPFLRSPDRPHQLVVETANGSPFVRVEVIGHCIGLYRVVGGVWAAVGFDRYPTSNWSIRPERYCQLGGHLNAEVSLPERVATGGDWGICSFDTCYKLDS